MTTRVMWSIQNSPEGWNMEFGAVPDTENDPVNIAPENVWLPEGVNEAGINMALSVVADGGTVHLPAGQWDISVIRGVMASGRNVTLRGADDNLGMSTFRDSTAGRGTDYSDQYVEYQMWLGRLDAQEDISPERPVNLYDYDWEIRRGIVNAIQARGGVEGHDAVNIIVEGVLREASSADWQLQTDAADLEGHLRHIV